MSDNANATSQSATTAASATPTWLARIHVTLKPVVLDPQGEAVLHGLQQLGYQNISSVRVGKYLEISLAAATQNAAEDAVRQMCDRLLANPVIERYDFTVTESAHAMA